MSFSRQDEDRKIGGQIKLTIQKMLLLCISTSKGLKRGDQLWKYCYMTPWEK